MRMAKRRIAHRVGFEKCITPWKELILSLSIYLFLKCGQSTMTSTTIAASG